MNDDGKPFSIVLDSIFDTPSVIKTDNSMNPIKINVEVIDELVKNIAIKVIKVGNLPLHGIKLLVNIAISLSLFESIILAPMTPHALQPNPMHMGVTRW